LVTDAICTAHLHASANYLALTFSPGICDTSNLRHREDNTGTEIRT